MSLDLVKPAQTAALSGPPQQERDRLATLERTEANHAAALAGLACLQRVEAPATVPGAPLAFPLTVATWNLERCYAVEKSAARIAEQGAGLVLLSEVDNGMARTGQRHTSRDVAAELGMNYAFGVEFLELELGAEVELEFCTDDFNRHGFHGNALLAHTSLQAPVMIRLEAHGHWFTPETPAKRIGTRCAIAAAVMTEAGPLYAVSVHLENRGDATYRETQVRGLIDAIDQLAGDIPVIIGGDLNTGLADNGDFEKETLFAHASDRGFERHGGPIGQMTTRPSRVSRNPRGTWKLDWFLTRGVEVTSSRIVTSVAPDGEVLSDHDMVVLEVAGLK
ncbi:MAG: endonuclease/exonuclease/phosphatase family protein [Devosia sp.]|uniref:endonuclease/exonuclease/phosphatase family protein n=1 Tax=Devosia sp. TaxID=1871048 RepID=UPI001AD2B176|nr:endonuclease/exonuclease/phosphatase family protein [Devosia sp.]MBN9316789.1 endonuclease/exonuclease/phosphatase family protein [Devosia sp.]